MSESAWLALYCFLVLLFSLAGGSLPLLGRITHSRLQFYLSASAGVMLGAAFFHVMPEAFEMAGQSFGLWISLGVVGIFCIERFIAPHSHEPEDHHHHEHGHKHDPDGKGKEILSGFLPVPVDDHRAAAPAVAGWMAVVGLTIHTFMNGVGLAGAVDAAFQEKGPAGAALLLPGLAMFLAIVLHKPADALAISVVLSRKGVSRRRITLVQLGFALMVPVGAAVYSIIRREVGGKGGGALERQLAGAALAFSAGTFLLIALSDLLPEVQFHRHDRVPLFLTLIFGLVLMGGIAFLEHQGEDNDRPAAREPNTKIHPREIKPGGA